MSTIAGPTSVSTSTIVETSAEHAFSVFTEGIGSWWDPSHHILQAQLADRHRNSAADRDVRAFQSLDEHRHELGLAFADALQGFSRYGGDRLVPSGHGSAQVQGSRQGSAAELAEPV